LLKTVRSDARSDFASTSALLVHNLIALHPPRDLESQKITSAFLDAVKKVSECPRSPQHDSMLQWGVHATVQGCGPDCSQSHSGDGNCLVCGLGWGPHNGHNCSRAPFAGRRGSWISSSQAVSCVPLHVETTPDFINVAFDPKSSKTEGMQSESPIESNPDKEVGTIITFNITHSSASSPKVIVGLTVTPPPLTAPVATKVALGLDLGELKIIDNTGQGKAHLDHLKSALSMSRSVIK